MATVSADIGFEIFQQFMIQAEERLRIVLLGDNPPLQRCGSALEVLILVNGECSVLSCEFELKRAGG